MNSEQQKYIAGLPYVFEKKADLSSMAVSDAFREKLSRVATVADLMDMIIGAHCFGAKDSLILTLLGTFSESKNNE